MMNSVASTRPWRPTRRDLLGMAGAAVGASVCPWLAAAAQDRPDIRTVAGVITIYRRDSHADVLLGKILQGWEQAGGPGPKLRLASLYVDQFPDDDLSRNLSAEFQFPICDTIADAITLGTGRVAVDGIISIGEHGDYPHNELGQHLYPRRRFFSEITAVLERHQQIVPVFNDKHLGPVWADAKWMYDRAQSLKIPFMAGSSLAVGYRDPDYALPMNCEVEACLGIGYSGLDIYGFHTLEFLQCSLERRRGGERGVRAIQCLPADAVQRLVDDGTIQADLLEAGLRASQTDRSQLANVALPEAAVFLIEYCDGLRAPVLMLPGAAQAISAAFRVQGRTVAMRAEERKEPRYPHFAYLLKGIEQLIHTGQSPYPVERTLLTAGLLDRLLTSRARGGERLVTPELEIAYQPVDYPHAPHRAL